MKDICKNCGAWHGLHKWDNNQCPRNGVEASYPKKQEYQNTYYQEDNSDEIAALTARVKELEGLLEFAVNNKQNFTEHDSDGVIKWWIEKSAAALRGEA